MPTTKNTITSLNYTIKPTKIFFHRIKKNLHRKQIFTRNMPFLKHDPKVDDRHYYTDEQVEMVQWVYIVALVAWIFIICVFGLWKTDVIGWIILSIPLVVFFSGYASADRLTVEIEKENFQANYFTIGLVLILPLLTWVKKEYSGNAEHFIRILIFAIIIILLSLLDVWVERQYMSVTKHVKSVFQTIAIVLIIYAFYSFYIDDPKSMFK